MSQILKHRRGNNEPDRNHNYNHNRTGEEESTSKGIDDDNSSSSGEEKMKQRTCQRVESWKRFIFVIVLICMFLVPQIPNSKKDELSILNIEIKTPDAIDWPLIHIVQSRFMQEQNPLETLGIARLKLFFTFCLPSMIQQSSQDFFWIIKTDPGFTKTAAFDTLVQLVRSHDNFYVVASNLNFIFGSAGREGSWRDGKEGMDLLHSKIYTGNIDRLKAAIALRNEKVVLETRLDADDGLHENFIEYIQDVALKRFQPFERDLVDDQKLIPDWLYWCSRRHIEWHSDTDGSLPEKQDSNLGSVEVGYINVIEHEKLCVTPGITVGYNVNSKKSNQTIHVPVYDHDKLYKNVRNSMSCYGKQNTKYEGEGDINRLTTRDPCLELVEDFIFCAIRSRTWTSAGMSDIDLAGKDGAYQSEELTEKLWAFSERSFGINKTDVEQTQTFLIRKKKTIAKENLLGQCSSGHSCKESAKEKLRQIIDLEANDHNFKSLEQ
mmetsp:Transcript_296/g.724  ORF Transcript_296/g.724 Transcript_296/m.724 type:complete len:492 (+) Transcript_296:26-1501(+)